MKKIPVFVVDDQTLFCDVLGSYLKAAIKFEFLGCFNSGNDFINYLHSENYNDRAVAILDINLPELNGPEIYKIVQNEYPQIKTVFLSSFYNRAIIRQMMNKYAGSFLVKNCHINELVDALEHVYHFNYYMSDSVLKAFDWSNGNPLVFTDLPQSCKLSKRELEILKLICLQMNSHEIADKLFLSVRTVENHRNSLLLKTGSTNSVGLVSFAIKNDTFFPS